MKKLYCTKLDRPHDAQGAKDGPGMLAAETHTWTPDAQGAIDGPEPLEVAADETSARPTIREFIQEARASCLHGGDQHCPYFKKGHPCCDCGATVSEEESRNG